MATDINVYAEKFEDGKWQPVPEPRITDYSEGKVIPIELLSEFDWGCRPYHIFPFLGVIRYGTSKERSIKPIKDRKGLPINLSTFYRKNFFDDDDYDYECDFGHSWLTLKEIIDYNWDVQFTEQSAYFEKLGKLLSQFGSPENVRIIYWFDS